MKGPLTPEQEAEIARLKKYGMTPVGIRDGRVVYENTMDEWLSLSGDAARGRRRSKQERDERKRLWELHEKQRAITQAAIDRAQKAGATHEEIMEDFCLISLPMSPARQFLNQRLKQSTTANFENNFKQALIALVKSDTPLDRSTRQDIAGELQRLYFPNPAREKRLIKQAHNQLLEELKNHLMYDRGMTADEAENAIVEDGPAKSMGIKKVETLHWRLLPSKKK
jgi:hypothetical protein